MTRLRIDFAAIGTTATVVVADAADLIPARQVLRDELDRIDRACSRFRDDSAVMRLYRAGGVPTVVDPALAEALAVALDVAAITDGLVDPTVGAALVELGYDRDFDAIDAHSGRRRPAPRPAAGWRQVRLDPDTNEVTVPAGVLLDLGATAKALAVDRAAAGAAQVCQSALISVGGDLCVAGRVPDGGWSVRVADSHLAGPDADSQIIAVTSGALATSSTMVRRWDQGGAVQHHVIDPATGRPAAEVWRTVSVAAATCVDANAASTAALLLGDAAPEWLADRSLPARLVRPDGHVLMVAGWPADVRYASAVA